MRISILLLTGRCASVSGLASADAYVSAQLGFGKRWAVDLGAYGSELFDARGTPCAGGAGCPNVVSEVGGNGISIVKAALAPRFRIGNNVQQLMFGVGWGLRRDRRNDDN